MLSSAIKRIDHIAVVVSNLDEALAFYSGTLGITPSRIVDFPPEGVKIAFLPLGGPDGSEIELLEPTRDDTGVARFLQKHGAGLHHICLETPDIEATLNDLRASGAMLLDEKPRPTAGGRGIFLHPKGTGGVLLEVIQLEPEAG